MHEMNDHHRYFGFEIAVPPTSDAFRESCLRAPDFLYEIASVKTGAVESWLVFWRSYENCRSVRGLMFQDNKEVEHDNCLSFLPLSVVFYGLADMNRIGRVCRRFFSIPPRVADKERTCDIPPVNLDFVRDRLSCSGNGLAMTVCTLRHLNSLFRRKRLVPCSPWIVPNEIREQYAFDLLTRATRIAGVIHDASSFQCLLPFYRELRYYGGLLLGSFEDCNRRAAEAEAQGRRLFRSLMHENWYPGSRHQRETYPSGLMKEWDEELRRQVLHDFHPVRRLRIVESSGLGYLHECGHEQDALPFDTAKRRHILPDNVPPVLIHAATNDWIATVP